LGVGVSRVNLPAAIATFKIWLKRHQGSYVCIRDAHGVILCQKDPEFRRIHNEAGMVTPDGMPIVWFCRAKGFSEVDRVYGPELMETVLTDPELRRRRHFLLGGGPGVAEDLARSLAERFPGFSPVGIYAPPPEATASGIDQQAVRALTACQAEFVWVGLGSPKQERWMARHHPYCPDTVMIGVGAAFDFLSGRKIQAPRWIQRSGCEWLFRLASEPRRLARRYFHTVPAFLVLSFLAACRLRNFALDD
jgi:N-acetylglucosaminyldiphosphoundecaprenol N-acetyl-beta-D-mannosaminyltransferase